ncbi:MAG: FliA/WhiG family RNA polymerase sigma factor [Lachnospiraceae bacterium]|nr:FliA/WhiG family RNA polymerase sigma factor [Lachnospiraceae bacterium]
MDETARNALWAEYVKNRTPELREQLILEYAPLVKLVAGRLSMYLGFNVEYDDLVGYGIFGLIDAIDKYDTMKDVKFETYASLRIRGAILDQIRKMDWIPRTIRQRQRRIGQAIREIEAATGRTPTDAEIAAHMEISEDEFYEWQSQMKVTGVISLNEFVESGSDIPEENNTGQARFVRPEDAVEKEELKKTLAEALELLTEKEKRVIVMYYYEDMTLKEIAAVLEVTESRVSQLHTRALQKMKQKMGVYMGILTEIH